jgi:hypothetical protein
MAVYRSSYDTVILGAGLGALVAGTILARTGNKTMILEEKSHPGGACTLITREGYPFVISPVLLLGLEKDGYCDQLFSELGLSLAMLKRPGGLLKRPNPFLQVVTEGYRLDLLVNRAEQLADYKREWGDAALAFQRFYQDLDNLDRRVYCFFYKKNLPGPPMPLRQRLDELQQSLRRRWMIRNYSCLNGQKHLSQFNLPSDFLKIMEWLNLLWDGGGLEQSSALRLLLKLSLMSREVTRPVGGLIRVCELLAKICLEYRGEIRYQQGITSIKKESRRNWVITLASGENIYTRQLVIHYPWNLLNPKPYGTVTFFFTVDPQVVPPPMCEQLLLCSPGGHHPVVENPLFVVLSLAEEESAYIEKKRLLMVSAFYPQGLLPTEQDLRQLLHEVIRNLHWLMPFSEGKIQYLGNNAQDRQHQSKRWGIAVPLLKRLRQIRYSHIEYACQPFDKSLLILPDYGSSVAMLTTEVRSAEEIAKRLLKQR